MNITKLIKNARFIWICGNGGSASTAEHFTTDLVKKGYKAICLNSNTSLITMLANDYGYDSIFSHQLDLYGNSNDLLITISCSGTSENITSVIDIAKSKEMDIFEFEKFGRIKSYESLENKHLEFAHNIAKKL